MKEFEFTIFDKTKIIESIVEEISKILTSQKYTVTFQKFEGKKFTYEEYLKFKFQKIKFFNKKNFQIFNYLVDELIKEIKESLELYDISSDSINKIVIEKEENLLFILISKYNSHGQGNTSISNIKPKSNSIHLMFKIEPIIIK